ncbi:unnamed protein product [Microthlaspi erraticum]|uniref:Uncharacterized protein n=1 Tax=Microthlaspi erraticum TaxID=1685480 RepID=A0A6D2IMM5_9BRAS|nr:unnamed protein product [Microthlaspi erraticum]
MKLAPIILISCVFFSLLPNLLSQGEQRRQWCPTKKQVFGGSCSNEDGGQECLNDLLSTWDPSVRLSPIYCDCLPHHKHKRMRICNCPNLICP